LNAVPQTQNSQRDSEDTATKVVFLANLIGLVATLCECSGDFMADRFRNDVWPVMGRQLQYLIQKGLMKSAPVREMKSSLVLPDSKSGPEQSTSPRWSDSERQLALSILQCLNRVFLQEECGKALEVILPTAGSMLLPLLDVELEFQVGALTMDCLKSMLQIDCDVLWRPLLELSGGISPCPLRIHPDDSKCHVGPISSLDTRTNDEKKGPSELSDKGSHLLASRCQELLDYVDTLPEQSVA